MRSLISQKLIREWFFVVAQPSNGLYSQLLVPKLISSHGMRVNLYNNQGRTVSGGRHVIFCERYGRQFNLDNLSKS